MGLGATPDLIARLVKRGFVKRASHSTARRSVMVQSLKGESTDTLRQAENRGLLSSCLNGFDPAERKVISAFLREVGQDMIGTLKEG
jgi:DNA-binding MarR family transcriptional regulator